MHVACTPDGLGDAVTRTASGEQDLSTAPLSFALRATTEALTPAQPTPPPPSPKSPSPAGEQVFVKPHETEMPFSAFVDLLETPLQPATRGGGGADGRSGGADGRSGGADGDSSGEEGGSDGSWRGGGGGGAGGGGCGVTGDSRAGRPVVYASHQNSSLRTEFEPLWRGIDLPQGAWVRLDLPSGRVLGGTSTCLWRGPTQPLVDRPPRNQVLDGRDHARSHEIDRD